MGLDKPGFWGYTDYMKNLIGYVKTDGGLDRTDTKNCTVRALALSLDIPYYQANDLFVWGGRRANRGVKNKVLYHVLVTAGVAIRRPITRRVCLSKFVRQHPKGVYYCITTNHAFALKDGMVFDIWPVTGRYQIEAYAKI